jgi:UDP-N-acetylglucosamine 2-epimerase
MKIMTIVGTRPEIIRLSRVINKLDQYFDHVLVHTGQNFDYELNEVFFRDLEIRRPDHFLEAAGGTAAETIGRVILASDSVFEEERPDALLILGDTNSSLAAIPAKRRKIPIFHMEAGNRCFDLNVPEEINRRIVDHISDINLPYTQIAREYLLREGLPPDQIIVTGSPMTELLDHYQAAIANSNVVSRLSLVPGQYFVVSAHREENVDSPEKLTMLLELLNHLANGYGKRLIISLHPRTRQRLALVDKEIHPLVEWHKPFGFFDYIELQKNARAVLSDSGTITEEASILNLAALNLREVHERPEGFEEGVVPLVGMSYERVSKGLEILDNQRTRKERTVKCVRDYESQNVSEKIVRIILSYTDFINRRTWKK